MDMDFVDWCSLVLQTCVKIDQTSDRARLGGIHYQELAQALALSLGTEDYGKRPDFRETTFYSGMIGALGQLNLHRLLEHQEYQFVWKVTKFGRDMAADLTPLWWQICADTLDPEHEQLLRAVNRLSPQTAPDHVWLKEIPTEILGAELGWDHESLLFKRVAKELMDWGLLWGRLFIGETILFSNYRGLVWETRHAFTIASRLIDNLIAEWETTSVDFKREVHTDTASDKAELIKDILSLANTRASGRRWMIIGFDDKKREYYGPPDPKLTQNHLEHLMAQYTAPVVDIHYEVVDYRKGKVGMLEVLRDPQKLPYRVAKSLGDKAAGDKKRIEQDQIFVRHGSQVETPSADELQELQDEGERARAFS